MREEANGGPNHQQQSHQEAELYKSHSDGLFTHDPPSPLIDAVSTIAAFLGVVDDTAGRKLIEFECGRGLVRACPDCQPDSQRSIEVHLGDILAVE